MKTVAYTSLLPLKSHYIDFEEILKNYSEISEVVIKASVHSLPYETGDCGKFMGLAAGQAKEAMLTMQKVLRRFSEMEPPWRKQQHQTSTQAI